MRQAPLGHDRSAARHDAGHALRRQRDVAQEHAGVDGEVVDALLRLLDQRLEEHVDVQILRLALDLLEALVDRHRADRHRRVAHDPLARLVDVLARRQIHHRVGAPAGRPLHLLDLFLDRRGHRRVADVGVDLHQEVAADDHRLELGVVDVRGNDRAAARHLVAHEFGRHVLAHGDEAHLLGELAAPRVVHLREVAVAARHARARSTAARSLGSPSSRVVTLRARGVVDAQRRLAARERDLALRHLRARRRARGPCATPGNDSSLGNDWQLHGGANVTRKRGFAT